MAKEQLDKKKRKNCSFCADKVEAIDYKDAQKLRKYLTDSTLHELSLTASLAQRVYQFRHTCIKPLRQRRVDRYKVLSGLLGAEGEHILPV